MNQVCVGVGVADATCSCVVGSSPSEQLVQQFVETYCASDCARKQRIPATRCVVHSIACRHGVSYETTHLSAGRLSGWHVMIYRVTLCRDRESASRRGQLNASARIGSE